MFRINEYFIKGSRGKAVDSVDNKRMHLMNPARHIAVVSSVTLAMELGVSRRISLERCANSRYSNGRAITINRI